ncbi:MAG TPA: methionyl-tRNA formyltransferase [Saprospiraceae bacterium]|nr:methionyl-tRNA formyltransferase [Saprospiraceae bacterium]
MRIVFMGTPDFAVASLKNLVESGEQVVAVVTAADKLGGRGGKQLLQSAVKLYASAHNIPILQPEKLKSKAFIRELQGFKADVQIVVAFRMLPEVVWDMPPLGTFNLHGSLLPKYRGAAPINWAIIRGEKITGVTSFKLKHEIDTGDVVMQATMPIDEDDTAGTLHDKMMVLGANVVLQTVQLLKSGNFTLCKQSGADATHAPKIFHNDCLIDFNKPTVEIYNFIRGMSPYPGAYFLFEGLETKIIQCRRHECSHQYTVGFIDFDKKHFHIYGKDGYIEVLELKMEGKKQLKIQDFLNGWSALK